MIPHEVTPMTSPSPGDGPPTGHETTDPRTRPTPPAVAMDRWVTTGSRIRCERSKARWAEVFSGLGWSPRSTRGPKRGSKARVTVEGRREMSHDTMLLKGFEPETPSVCPV